MGTRLIADEVLRAIPVENLVRWVKNSAEGLGYAASYLTESDPYTIVLFKKIDGGDGIIQLIEAGQLIASIYGTKDELRYRIYCENDRQSAGFPPCHVGAVIMRYLLRLLDEPERAAAWQPLPADSGITRGKDMPAQKEPKLSEVRTPKLPKRYSDRNKWAATWRLIREYVNKGMNASELEIRLQQQKETSHLPGDEKTLRKIIEAGKAGLLDDLHKLALTSRNLPKLTVDFPFFSSSHPRLITRTAFLLWQSIT